MFQAREERTIRRNVNPRTRVSKTASRWRERRAILSVSRATKERAPVRAAPSRAKPSGQCDYKGKVRGTAAVYEAGTKLDFISHSPRHSRQDNEFIVVKLSSRVHPLFFSCAFFLPRFSHPRFHSPFPSFPRFRRLRERKESYFSAHLPSRVVPRRESSTFHTFATDDPGARCSR